MCSEEKGGATSRQPCAYSATYRRKTVWLGFLLPLALPRSPGGRFVSSVTFIVDAITVTVIVILPRELNHYLTVVSQPLRGANEVHEYHVQTNELFDVAHSSCPTPIFTSETHNQLVLMYNGTCTGPNGRRYKYFIP